MSPFIAALNMVAAICAGVAALHFTVGLRTAQKRVHLLFALVALLVSVQAFVSQQAFLATTVEESVRFHKPSSQLGATFGLALVWFLWAYAGLKRWRFPGISSAGRVRMDWRTTFRVRLISGKSIWWNINGTLNLDNDPPSLSPGTDYVATTSISYDFP